MGIKGIFSKKEAQVSSSPQPNMRLLVLRSKIKPIMIIIIAALVLGAGYFGWSIYNDRQNTNEESGGTSNSIEPEDPTIAYRGICDIDLFATGVSQLNENDFFALGETIEKLVQVDGYDQSQDCVYMALYYYINTSHPDEAKEAYERLKIIRDRDVGYNNLVARYVYDDSTIESNIENMSYLNEIQYGGEIRLE